MKEITKARIYVQKDKQREIYKTWHILNLGCIELWLYLYIALSTIEGPN